jgi:tetratricopeptide (TPR) repeat protein
VIDELRRRGAELKALHDTGQTTEALRRVHGLETDARAAGYPPVEAELLSRIALLYIDMGDAKYKAATEGSFWAALESRQDELAANDATLLSAVTGRDPAQGAEARRWDRLAAALLARMGPGHDVTRAWLLQARGNVATAEGKFDTAQREYAEAAALKEKALGPDHPDVARSLDAAAVSLVGMGQAAASIPLHERSIAIMERSFGRDSPQVSYLFGNLGEAYLALHREDEAIRAFERAIALRKNVGDPMSDFLAYPLVGLGRALVVVGRAAEAVAPLERALLIREKNDPAAERLGEVRFALGRALAARGRGGDAERARALVARARADYAETPPSDARTAALAELDRWRPPAR